MVGGQRHAPAALPPGRTRYPLCRRLGGLHPRSGQVWKILPPTVIRSPDRPAHSESLYRLRYPGPPFLTESYSLYSWRATGFAHVYSVFSLQEQLVQQSDRIHLAVYDPPYDHGSWPEVTSHSIPELEEWGTRGGIPWRLLFRRSLEGLCALSY
jgi:hypothetical protein